MKKYKKREQEYKDFVFELTAPEGADFTDFKVNRWGYLKPLKHLVSYYGEQNEGKGHTVYMYAHVVGLVDKKAPKRNWGLWSRRKEAEKIENM